MHKTIVVTGATSGIGYAVVDHLASLGHSIIAVGRNIQTLDSLCQKYPAKIKSVAVDLTNKDEWQKIISAVERDTTGLYLIHSAGVARPHLLSTVTEDEWNNHYIVNTQSLIFVTKMLLPYLKNGGRVLNISTGLAHGAMPAMAPYGVTKAASYMWKEYSNVELNSQQIYFGSAMPGVVDTPIQHNLRNCSLDEFPAVNVFKGFSDRNELLKPITAAKFIAWLLLQVENDRFSKGDWDIYDVTHHSLWASEGEVKPRQKPAHLVTDLEDGLISKAKNIYRLFSSLDRKSLLSILTVVLISYILVGISAIAIYTKLSQY